MNDLLPRVVFFYREFVPEKWELSVEKYSDELMVNGLLTTLKDFVSQGNLSKALTTFCYIRSHVAASSSCDILVQSLSSLLLCCTNLKSLPVGKQIHAHIIILGHGQNHLLVPKLVTFYTAFDLLSSARIITETSDIIHPLPWNVLISAYVRNKSYGEAILAYKHMRSKGTRPDNFTYPSVLKACGEQLDLKFGKEVHGNIVKSISAWDLFVQNALISMYSKCGEVDIARQIFENMPVKDAVSWNSIISAYAAKGIWAEVNQLFARMDADSVELNTITWNTLAGGFLRTGNFTGALKFLAQMKTFGIQLDSVAVIIGLSACSHINLLKVGKAFHGLAIHQCYVVFDNVNNALINMYARCRDLIRAYYLFRSVKEKSIITWNTIISGYTHWNMPEEASFLFREMLFSGVEPNYVTVASILPICARVANLQHGREFHGYITRHEEFNDYLLLWNSLVDMYARSGKILLAKKLFDSISKKDAFTYTSIIAGYGMQGKGKAAIKLFKEMIRYQINPDHVTMIAILSACSHSGLVLQGQFLFDQMQRQYGITPRLEHFSCMVDLFSRAGLLAKAEEIIIRMPFNPTTEMWVTLLGACRIYGNIEIGERAAENLLEMNPENPGYYVLIANMYAAAGNWGKLARVNTFMRDLGIRR